MFIWKNNSVPNVLSSDILPIRPFLGVRNRYAADHLLGSHHCYGNGVQEQSEIQYSSEICTRVSLKLNLKFIHQKPNQCCDHRPRYSLKLRNLHLAQPKHIFDKLSHPELEHLRSPHNPLNLYSHRSLHHPRLRSD